MLRLLRSFFLPLCLALSPLAGCQALAPTAPTAVAAKRQVVVAGDRTLMVRPQLGGYRTQSAVSAYGKDDIAHLLLKLYVVDGEEEVEAVTADNQPIERDILNDPTTPEDELAVSVAIAGLKPNTTYRVKAIAYKAAGFSASDVISTQDASSYVTVTLTDDDRPTMEALKVKLVARDVSMRLAGTNVQLTDARSLSSSNFNKKNLKVAFGSGGRALVVWEDYRATNSEIYGQAFNGDGTPAGSAFVICTAANAQERPSVAYNSQADEFLVVWHDNRDGNFDLYGQRVSADGSLPTAGVSGNFAIATDTSLQQMPSVAYSSQADEYLVVWQDDRGGNLDIYGQRVGADGSLPTGGVTGNFAIAANVSLQQMPSIAYSSQTNEYLVTWSEMNGGNFDIFGRRVSADGHWPTTGVTGSFALTTDPAFQLASTIAYNSQADEYLVTWHDYRNGNADIYAQRVSADGSLPTAGVTDNFAICTAPNNQYGPVLAYNSQADEYLVTWQGDPSGAYDLYGQRVNADGNLPTAGVTGNFAISVATSSQEYPAVAYNSQANEFLVAWQDNRSGAYDLYSLRIGPSFTATDHGVSMFASTYPDASEEKPRVAIGGDRHLVVWQDDRKGTYDIYGRVFNRDGTPVGAEFAIAVAANNQYSPTVAYNSRANEFLVTWGDYRSGNWDVFGQRVSADGKLPTTGVTGNFALSTAAGTQANPTVAYNSQADEYLVTWYDFRSGLPDIYGQRVSADGSRPTTGVTGNFAICAAAGNQQLPSVAYSSQSNEYLVTWHDSRSGNHDIYGQRVSADGSLPTTGVTGNFAICAAANAQQNPVVAYNSRANEFLVAWSDYRSGNWDLYGQRVSADGSLPTGNFAISTAANAQQMPVVAYSSQADEHLVAWQDKRSGNYATYGQRVAGSGDLIGAADSTVNFALSTATNGQEYPAIAYDGQANEFLVIWQDLRDGNNNLYGQRLDSFLVQ